MRDLAKTEHKGHNVLGHYCWNCKTRTTAHIEGWNRPSRGEFVHHSPWTALYTEAVIWGNGDNERVRDQSECGMCGGERCTHPVNRFVTQYGDDYREIGYLPQE